MWKYAFESDDGYRRSDNSLTATSRELGAGIILHGMG